jgi:hypothetical protein
MERNIIYYCLLALTAQLLFQSCQTIKQSPKYGFNEGYYKSRIHHKKLKKVYIVPGDDSIKVYTKKAIQRTFVDTLQSFKVAFPSNIKPDEFETYSFRKNTFDIDVISILLRFRPAVDPYPDQFSSASFNGSIFFGYRTDIYHMKYKQTPLGAFRRNMTHYGFSVGAFSGIGSSNINGSVTQDSLQISYDAPINVSGVAVFIGVERFTYGVTLGFDHLLDKNKKLWIYQGKPWIGLSIGWNIH